MSNRTVDRVLLGGIGLLVISLVGVLAGSLNEHLVKDGDSAPSFSIRTDTGRNVTVRDFGGKVLVLNFWATWCPPCVREIPALDLLQKRLKDQGVVVLAVSVDEDESAYRKFLQQHPVSFQTARDPSRGISNDYGTYKYPETYIIDRTGRVVKKVIGEENWGDDRAVSYVQSFL